MNAISVLSEDQLRGAVPLTLDVVDCIENAFKILAQDGVVMPPVLSMHLPMVNGEVDIKTAYLPGFSGFAVKVSPGFFNNPALGLASTSGLMVLFSAQTGQVQAVLLDNGYLTDLRTAAAGAVAARALSRPDAHRAAIFGAGTQALLQLQALCLVRPIKQATIWARNPDQAVQAARIASTRLGIAVDVITDPAKAVAGADIIITTTPATQPIVMAEWLQAGQHITAMGSDQSSKNELEAACLTRADLYVADRFSQTKTMGELRAAIEAGVIDRDRIDHSPNLAELSDVLTGKHHGRRTSDDITIADLTGTGAQDTAIATYALAAIHKGGHGT
ncbi:cyclodeaminase [Pacificibacter marinus]|uniref:L-lysine cyclodeaminase n=1 Tax=Pacificibacter marinus TaxID=658057 RepID=A0A1Y5RT24_9RHOB|nr:cyclodeaminase [Pacificibacter marinus]SEK41953.1 ornithine cyclodeaminase [Pacificibacter marinus]SLN24521.1 L-lysine cyclodeaminase [Pacificibacter marinus]